MTPRALLATLTLFTLSLAPGLAHAGGFEFAGPGTRALGRGVDGAA